MKAQLQFSDSFLHIPARFDISEISMFRKEFDISVIFVHRLDSLYSAQMNHIEGIELEYNILSAIRNALVTYS